MAHPHRHQHRRFRKCHLRLAASTVLPPRGKDRRVGDTSRRKSRSREAYNAANDYLVTLNFLHVQTSPERSPDLQGFLAQFKMIATRTRT